MKVSIYTPAKKEATKLGAEVFFQQAIDMLRDVPFDRLCIAQEVTPLKGDTLKGAYEVKPSRYRSIFLFLCSEQIFIFAFFKKEGARLKQHELNLIAKRLKEIKKIYGI